MPNRFIVACIVGTFAFWAYTRTLVPGVDLGDTGGFQAAVLWPDTSARQAYPLYYFLARPFVSTVSAANPARGLNLFSALWGGIAVGLLTYLCADVVHATTSGAVAGVFLAFSYTYWTQAIIAEVYTLHLTFVALSLLALRTYARRPSLFRLAAFFAVYALGFGNHLSMILLLVPCTVFLLQTTPAPRSLFRARVIVIAVGIAALGALQYWPNLMAVWRAPDAPAAWTDRLAAFWFDVTKSDWRESMVLGVGRSQIADRVGMWWFDLRQQFGLVGIILVVAGAIRMQRISKPWGTLMLLAWSFCTAFALSYNVGDTHVFLLPGHFAAAWLAGAAIAPAITGTRPDSVENRAPVDAVNTKRPRSAAIVLASQALTAAVLAYAGWRAWDTWPAVDRHNDRRGEQLVSRLTLGLDDRNAVLVTDLNWQLENVLLYYGRYERPNIAWTRLANVLPHFPFFVSDNEEISRAIVLTPQAAAGVTQAYGPLYPLLEDSVAPADSLSRRVEKIPRGAPYVLSLLTPPREERLDTADLASALNTLTRGHSPPLAHAGYEVVAGLAGEPPSLVLSSSTPFRRTFNLLDDPFTVRMESWLPTDTFRRAGFGQILRGHSQVLILERGISLVSFGTDGLPSPPFYAASLFGEISRFRVAPSPTRLARQAEP